MHRVVLLWVGLLAGDVHDYSRPLDAKKFDQATLDAGAFGEKKVLKREDQGLRITLAPGAAETGWKTPQTVKFGGDFTVTAQFAIEKFPKPAQDDGVAIGVAIATQNLDQPEATLVRVIEPSGADVYRSIEKSTGGPSPGMPGMPAGMVVQAGMVVRMGGRPGAQAAKPPRKTFPAKGKSFRIEFKREGPTVRFHVLDDESETPRYLGQHELGTNDLAGVKLFVTNRNGAEAVDVVLRDLTIRADRITGLGTAVHTIFGDVIHGEPTALEAGKLIVGGPPKTPPSATPAKTPNPNPSAKPADAAPKAPAPAAPAPAAPAAAPAPAPAPAAAATAEVEVGAPNATAACTPSAPAESDEKPAEAAKVAEEQPAEKPQDTVTTEKASEPPKEADTKEKAAEKPKEAEGKEKAAEKPKDSDAKEKEKTAVKPKEADAKGKATEKPKEADAKGKAAEKPKDAKATPPPQAKVEPKAKLPLDEVESITFERAITLSGRFIGQPNLDFTMPRPEPAKDGEAAKTETKGDDVLAPPPGTVAPKTIPKLEPKPNGICDLHLTLASLREVPIKQVTINTQTDKGPAAWRIDTTGSNDWPLVLRRAGTETWADLFLEPPAGDLNGKDLTVNVTYNDGQSGNATIKVDKKVDPKLAFDPKVVAPALDARVYLTGDEQLFGKLVELASESLRLQTPWGDPLVVPLARVTGIYMGLPEHKESTESFARRLRSRGTEDLLLARTKDGEVIAIPGVAEGTKEDKLLFHFQEKTRSLSLKQVEGLVLAARPEPERPSGLRPTFSMAGGLVISGLWKEIDTKTWKIETDWGEPLNLPALEIRSVRFRGGQVSYLSDLEPSRVEETPFLSRRSPWRKDVNLAGTPLKMDGRTYERGLAVHSRSVLTYDLDGQYSNFKAVVGFDESAKGLGRVDCRVFADDKELYANKDLRSDAPPVDLNLTVTGAAQLKLVVDFGPDQDTGDRIIWANARLFRRPPPTKPNASASASASHSTTANPTKTQTPKPGSGQ